MAASLQVRAGPRPMPHPLAAPPPWPLQAPPPHVAPPSPFTLPVDPLFCARVTPPAHRTWAHSHSSRCESTVMAVLLQGAERRTDEGLFGTSTEAVTRPHQPMGTWRHGTMVRTGGQGKEEIVECAGTLTRQEHSCSRLGPGPGSPKKLVTEGPVWAAMGTIPCAEG